LENYESVWNGNCDNEQCGKRILGFDKHKGKYNQLKTVACDDGDSAKVKEPCASCGKENVRDAHNWHPMIAKD
jgi:hypothetical protein